MAFVVEAQRRNGREGEVASGGPFADLAPLPAEHFRLTYYAAVLHVIEQAAIAFGGRETLWTAFPFLGGYAAELRARGADTAAWWTEARRAWEAGVPGHLPLRDLQTAAMLDDATLTLLIGVGLGEEDARFGLVVEAILGTPGQRRPTVGLLEAWWRDSLAPKGARVAVRRLLELGLLRVVTPDLPRHDRGVEVPAAIWDALRGDAPDEPAPGIIYRPPDRLATLDALVLPSETRRTVEALPALLASGEVRGIVLRGPRRNGRRTLIGAIARALERGTLETDGPVVATDDRWRLLGPLATALHAMPVVVFDLAPGETGALTEHRCYDGPMGVVLGRQGGIDGVGAERSVAITLVSPDTAERRRHWLIGTGAGHPPRDLDEIAARYRLTSGNIRRVTRLAPSYAALAGREAVTLADVQEAGAALNRQALDTLATRVPAIGDWGQLAVRPETRQELRDLVARCRHRERLQERLGAAFGDGSNAGVRALFGGPSGTGKTLAARLLAADLMMDLYRLDLSAVVDKYIGETEKNLSRLLAWVEELDVILLLDEGDALLGQRSDVHSATDRYANLETNYLLQRLETFDGILIVTTNAADRIDGAFERRMDVVVTFHPPDIEERWAIWRLHLPVDHAVPPKLLRELATSCSLSGGQIRNAALHAALLALDDSENVAASHLESAVQREYRKAGKVCPLQRGV